MKKVIAIILLVLSLCALGLFLPQEPDYDYLRIHIRANSNSAVDQNVKYEIKDDFVEFLTPYLCNVPTKQDAINTINSLKGELTTRAKQILKNKGFKYSVNIKICEEYFPTRTYSNVTLSSGYYSAVIVELGSAEGDNWWCVMYPPLCFVNNFEMGTQIKYKSKIVEWFKALFN